MVSTGGGLDVGPASFFANVFNGGHFIDYVCPCSVLFLVI